LHKEDIGIIRDYGQGSTCSKSRIKLGCPSRKICCAEMGGKLATNVRTLYECRKKKFIGNFQ
jgi:hypothetical protein